MAVQIYARVVDGAVVELWPHDPVAPMPDPQPTPAEAFGAELGAEFVPCNATVQQGWTTSDGGKTFAPPVSPAPIPVDLTTYAAAARYAKETAGITVGTAPIATDRDSQQAITGMWAAAQIDPTTTVQFKTAGAGFVSVNAAQIAKIASAVIAHVQACFAAEAQLVASITAGTTTTTAQIDQAFAAITA